MALGERRVAAAAAAWHLLMMAQVLCGVEISSLRCVLYDTTVPCSDAWNGAA
jgi:hypothetical protein